MSSEQVCLHGPKEGKFVPSAFCLFVCLCVWLVGRPACTHGVCVIKHRGNFALASPFCLLKKRFLEIHFVTH